MILHRLAHLLGVNRTTLSLEVTSSASGATVHAVEKCTLCGAHTRHSPDLRLRRLHAKAPNSRLGLRPPKRSQG